MTKAEKAIQEAMLKGNFSENGSVIMLQDIDKDYWEFLISMNKVRNGKTFWNEVSLFCVTRATFPDPSLLVKVTNIAYSWESMVKELARVMDALWNHEEA